MWLRSRRPLVGAGLGVHMPAAQDDHQLVGQELAAHVSSRLGDGHGVRLVFDKCEVACGARA